MEIDRTLCTSCGKCIDNCVFHTVSEKKAGYAVFVGGLWGKRQRMGNRLPEIYTKEEVFQLVEKAILLYREQGWTGRAVRRVHRPHRPGQLLSPSSPATRFWPANSPFWTPLCSSGARAADPPAGGAPAVITRSVLPTEGTFCRQGFFFGSAFRLSIEHSVRNHL